jgi:hypothetical protein
MIPEGWRARPDSLMAYELKRIESDMGSDC